MRDVDFPFVKEIALRVFEDLVAGPLFNVTGFGRFLPASFKVADAFKDFMVILYSVFLPKYLFTDLKTLKIAIQQGFLE